MYGRKYVGTWLLHTHVGLYECTHVCRSTLPVLIRSRHSQRCLIQTYTFKCALEVCYFVSTCRRLGRRSILGMDPDFWIARSGVSLLMQPRAFHLSSTVVKIILVFISSIVHNISITHRFRRRLIGRIERLG